MRRDQLKEKKAPLFEIFKISRTSQICPYCDGWLPPFCICHICAGENEIMHNTYSTKDGKIFYEERNVTTNKVLCLIERSDGNNPTN